MTASHDLYDAKGWSPISKSRSRPGCPFEAISTSRFASPLCSREPPLPVPISQLTWTRARLHVNPGVAAAIHSVVPTTRPRVLHRWTHCIKQVGDISPNGILSRDPVLSPRTNRVSNDRPRMHDLSPSS